VGARPGRRRPPRVRGGGEREGGGEFDDDEVNVGAFDFNDFTIKVTSRGGASTFDRSCFVASALASTSVRYASVKKMSSKDVA